MASNSSVSPSAGRPHRRGRPTAAEAAMLDESVREAALRLFLEHGYETTSMEAIAKAAGTTKASLYARFPGKAEVFRSVLTWATNRPDWPFREPELPPPDDLGAALSAVADAAATRALHPSMVKLSRIAAAQADRFPDVAERTQRTTRPRRRFLVELLRHHAAEGAIRADDPELQADLFLAMVASGPARLATLGLTRDAAEQQRHTDAAVELFVRSLRPG